MLKNMSVEENTPERLQVQMFENTLAFVLFMLGAATVLAAVYNLNIGDGEGAALCFSIAVLCAGLFGAFVGVKRMTFDREADLISLTFRSILRNKRDTLPLSSVSRVSLVDGSDGRNLEVGPDDPFGHRNIYGVRLILEDGSEREIYRIKGRHVFDLGRLIQDWHADACTS